MHKMFKALVLAAGLTALQTGLAHADLKIGFAAEPFPPFSSKDASGKWVGWEVDAIDAVCKAMNEKCDYVEVAWDGIIPALQSKKFDAIIASMSITPERKEQVTFSKKYYNTPPAIAVPKDSPIKEATAAGLKGKTIGAQGSTTHSNYAEKHMPDSELKLYPTADEYKLDITNGRIDAVIDDIVVLSQWIKSDAGKCCKILSPLPIDVDINGEGAGIAVRKGETALADKFSAAILAIRANGKYKAINDKYFDFDAYGK